MTTITTRAGKGSQLTWTEVDSNFTNLNTDKLEHIVQDTTPQLGGNLDVNGQQLVSTSNGNIVLAPNGTGRVSLSGNLFPSGTGSNGQVLTTNGSGSLSWATASGGMTQAVLYISSWNAPGGGDFTNSTGTLQSWYAGSSGVTVSGTSFTLPAGTWRFYWQSGSSSGSSGTSNFRFQNTTDSATIGSNWTFSSTDAAGVRGGATSTELVYTGSKTIQLQSYSSGNPQNYINVIITVIKVA